MKIELTKEEIYLLVEHLKSDLYADTTDPFGWSIKQMKLAEVILKKLNKDMNANQIIESFINERNCGWWKFLDRLKDSKGEYIRFLYGKGNRSYIKTLKIKR